MAIKYLSSINLSGNELQNAKLHPLGTAPAVGGVGAVYYNTTDDVLFVSDGTSWISVSGDITEVLAGTGIAVSGETIKTVALSHLGIQNLTDAGGDAIMFWDDGVSATGWLIPSSASGITITGTSLVLTDIPNSSITNSSLTVSPGTGMSGGGPVDLGSSVSLDLANTSVTAGSYISGNFTVDAQGRLTAASDGGAGTMTSWTLAGDSGSSQTVTDGNTVTFTGGSGLVSSAVATDTLRMDLDINDLVVTTAFDGSADYFAVSDAGVTRKILGNNISLTQFAAPTATISMGTNKVTNVIDPTAAQDAATKNYVDVSIAGSGALIYQGGYNASTNTPNLDTPPTGTINQGFTYTVTVAGTFFTEAVQIGDLIIANSDTPTTLAGWTTVQNNIDIASATVAGLASFPTAGGLSITGAGAVSMPAVVTASTKGGAAKSLTATVDNKGRVTSLAEQSIQIVTSQITDFCADVNTCVASASEYATSIGNGTLTSYPVVHNLGTRDVIVEVYDTATYETVLTTVVRTSTSTVTISTASALPTNGARVLVKSIG